MSYALTTIEQTAGQALDVLLPGETIIFADQDGPRPTSDTYVTIKLTGDSGRGLRSFVLTDTPGTSAGDFVQEVGRFRESVLLLQAYGPRAFSVLRDVEFALDDPITTYEVSQLGIVITGSSGVRRVQVALASETEDRATCTYTLRYRSVTQRDLAALRRTEGTLTINGDPQSPPVINDNLDA